MIELSSKANCTGCSACANICPRGCIRMICTPNTGHPVLGVF
ncbi:4Fe-4S binding protein [uncultured Phascolarctobacterium sp.]